MQLSIGFGNPPFRIDGDNLIIKDSDGLETTLPNSPTALQDWATQIINLNAKDFNLATLAMNRLAKDPQMDSPELWSGAMANYNPENPNGAQVLRITEPPS